MGIKKHHIISIGTRAVVTIIILLVGISIFNVLAISKPEVARRDVEATVLRVETMTASLLPVQRRWEGFGTAEVRDEASVPSEITATIKSVPDELRNGAAVSKGQPLVFLDDVDVRNRELISQQVLIGLAAQISALEIERSRTSDQLMLAEDELAASTADWERAQESRRNGGASDSEVDAKRRLVKSIARIESDLRKQIDLLIPRGAELAAAVAEENARLAMIQTDLERCIIRSPLEGILQTMDVHVGEQVTPGMRVARIVSLKRIEIPLRFPVSARQSISVGDSVELLSEGAANSCWYAEIVRVAPETDRATRTCIAYAEVAQSATADPLLVPGQYVKAALQMARAEERFLIPRRAVLNETVWVITAAGQAEPRKIDVLFYLAGDYSNLGPSDTEWAVIGESSPIQRGETIVLSNLDALTPGMALLGDG